MKQAWLVKRYEDSDWEIVFTRPSLRDYLDVRAIVYAELEEGEPE